MKRVFLPYLTTAYDSMSLFWNAKKTSRAIALLLMFFFASSLGIIGLNKLGALPPAVGHFIPGDIFAVVRLAFSMLLMVEVISLIFIIADSVSLAAGKQLEIMSLLLLREAFSDISQLSYSIDLESDWLILVQILMAALAAIVLFVVKFFFHKWHYIQCYQDMRGYINIKKHISLLLLFLFLGVLIYDAYRVVAIGENSLFLRSFYTILIFTDIFLVFVGQYYTPSFVATFRNSGFAVSTVFMRIALGSPHHMSAIICVFAALYLLLLSWVLSRFGDASEKETAKDVKYRTT